jgi:toxin ParE1/3/4
VAEYKVVLHREAERELAELYDYIADQAGAAIAWNFISGIRDFCIELTTFPERGTRQDDIRKGLRVFGYKRRVSIAFAVAGGTVVILGIFYGGRQIRSRSLRSRK